MGKTTASGLPEPADGNSTEEILQEARERFKDAYTNDYVERDRIVEDLEFAYDPERQWDTFVKENRKDRPCLTFNRIEPAIDQIVGDQRKTRLGIQTKPSEEGDKDTARILGGLIRNIEAISDAETVWDEQFELAVAGGFGAIRIINDYNNDDNFDQDCFIKSIRNPAGTVWFDPAAEEWHKQDGDFMFVTNWISTAEFARNWPDKTPASWDTYKDDEYWRMGDLINVAEYYRKKWMDRELVQLSDGRICWLDEVNKITDELAQMGLEIENQRSVRTFSIEWFKMSGWDVLDGPLEFNWRYFPVVPIYGKRRVIKNREQTKGITRNAKDPQKSYNYQRSSTVEAALMTPKTPYLVTSGMVKPFKKLWDNLHKTNRPYLPFAHDPEQPNGPIRQDFQQLPASMIALAEQDAADIRATTGIHEPSLGAQQSAQQSGQAINAVQSQGDIGSYRFIDNLAKSIQMTGRILVDIIPTVYDAERTIRIIGEDGTEEWVKINSIGEDGKPLHDLAQGKYDVVVDVGPSHKTEREAASEFLSTVIPNSPLLQQVAMDIVFKYQDIPGAKEIYERLRQTMVSSGQVPPKDEEEQKWAPQGPSEMEQLQLRLMMAEVLKSEADAQEKLAKIEDLIAGAYKKTMEGAELEVAMGADAVAGAMMVTELASAGRQGGQQPPIPAQQPQGMPGQPQGAPVTPLIPRQQ